RTARLVRHEQEWRLVASDYTLASFRSDEEARRALDTVEYYRFTEQCLVGGPPPAFSYFLVHGQAPRGLQLGTSGIPFRPELLEVRKIGDRFTIADGDRVLLDLGTREQDAKDLLQA